MLRDFEIGFAGGSNQMRAPETPASRPVALEHSQLTDADIRGQLLKVFYDRRLNADGWVPTSDIDLSPNAVDRRAIGASCQHMADVGLIQWKPLRGANEGFVIGMAKITGKGVAAFEARQSGDIELQFPSQYPAAAAYPQPQDDAQMSEGALTDIREAVSTIKAELPALATSNSVKAEIAADITQIEVETERPEPRRRFIKLYLESLRDNLAKAAGAATAGGLFALVAGLLAKYFHVF